MPEVTPVWSNPIPLHNFGAEALGPNNEKSNSIFLLKNSSRSGQEIWKKMKKVTPKGARVEEALRFQFQYDLELYKKSGGNLGRSWSCVKQDVASSSRGMFSKSWLDKVLRSEPGKDLTVMKNLADLIFVNIEEVVEGFEAFTSPYYDELQKVLLAFRSSSAVSSTVISPPSYGAAHLFEDFQNTVETLEVLYLTAAPVGLDRAKLLVDGKPFKKTDPVHETFLSGKNKLLVIEAGFSHLIDFSTVKILSTTAPRGETPADSFLQNLFQGSVRNRLIIWNVNAHQLGPQVRFPGESVVLHNLREIEAFQLYRRATGNPEAIRQIDPALRDAFKVVNHAPPLIRLLARNEVSVDHQFAASAIVRLAASEKGGIDLENESDGFIRFWEGLSQSHKLVMTCTSFLGIPLRSDLICAFVRDGLNSTGLPRPFSEADASQTIRSGGITHTIEELENAGFLRSTSIGLMAPLYFRALMAASCLRADDVKMELARFFLNTLEETEAGSFMERLATTIICEAMLGEWIEASSRIAKLDISGIGPEADCQIMANLLFQFLDRVDSGFCLKDSCMRTLNKAQVEYFRSQYKRVLMVSHGYSEPLLHSSGLMDRGFSWRKVMPTLPFRLAYHFFNFSWRTKLFRAEHYAALDCARKIADPIPREPVSMQALRMIPLGISSFWTGKTVDSLEILSAVLKNSSFALRKPFAIFGDLNDPVSSTESYLGLLRWQLREPGKSERHLKRAVVLARESGKSFAICTALFFNITKVAVEIASGNPRTDRFQKLLDELDIEASTRKSRFWVTAHTMFDAWRRGDEKSFRIAKQQWNKKTMIASSLWGYLHIDLLDRQGFDESALSQSIRVTEWTKKSGERWLEGRLYIQRAAILGKSVGLGKSKHRKLSEVWDCLRIAKRELEPLQIRGDHAYICSLLDQKIVP